MDYRQLSLEEQVAQLLMVGYEGAQPNAITRRFLERGVGGIIFFRDNFESLENAQTVADQLKHLSDSIPSHLPRPLLGIDQEGGQVERLPHTLFPTMLTPRAVALSPQPEPLANAMYTQLAQSLVQLGFNLDFFPTLDVNLNPKNPIIGVRSFGDDPETVWRFSKIALNAFEQAGLIAVGKHFPGHGNGTVDSHLDLPTLHFTETELQPFRQAIDAGIPAILVAHGFYPALQTTEAEHELHSSASPAIIQGLLRQQCGFTGVIITDDMCMGAITKHRSPVEAALVSLKAGVDILLYKQSTQDEWEVYEAVLNAFRTGQLPLSQLQQSVDRILALKTRYLNQPKPALQPEIFSQQACQGQANATARQGIQVLYGNATQILPLSPKAKILLIHPDRKTMGNYAFDIPTSDELDTLLDQQDFPFIDSLLYPPKSSFSASDLLDQYKNSPDVVVMVTFNPIIYEGQAELYQLLRMRFPETPIILASAGTPYDRELMHNPTLHLGLCSYRPASMRALTEILAHGFESKNILPSQSQPVMKSS
jgi:beta-N-acetylhexosaminidase